MRRVHGACGGCTAHAGDVPPMFPPEVLRRVMRAAARHWLEHALQVESRAGQSTDQCAGGAGCRGPNEGSEKANPKSHMVTFRTAPMHIRDGVRNGSKGDVHAHSRSGAEGGIHGHVRAHVEWCEHWRTGQ
eukprot:365270-Chlamydomonas_euryale.AAC.16